MADVSHAKLLRKGRKEWNKWRNENPELRPNLSYICLNREFISKFNLSNSNLERSDLYKSNLKYSNLSGSLILVSDLRDTDLQHCKCINTSFYGSNLIGADLSSANMIGSNLRNSNLSNCKVSDADLSDATLIGTDASYSDFSETCLRGANLRWANFAGSKFKGADLTGAKMGSTNLCSVDLREAVGLSKVFHTGPSMLDLRTSYWSSNLPINFLQGCGLTLWEAEAARLHRPDITSKEITDIVYKIHDMKLSNPIQYYSCFISYSHKDEDFALAIYEALQQRGIRCWLDEHQMLPGDDIYDSIDRGVKLWDKVLLCCSRDSLNSWWVDNEINLAFEKERSIMNSKGSKVPALIPLNIDGYVFSKSWKSGKKGQLLSRYIADFTQWKEDRELNESQVDKVVRSLRADWGGREQPPETKL